MSTQMNIRLPEGFETLQSTIDLLIREQKIANLNDLTLPDPLVDDLFIYYDSTLGWIAGTIESVFGGYRDITGNIEVRTSGPNRPTWSQISGTDYWAYLFTAGDEVDITFHIPHDIKPGADISFHSHWTTDGVDTGNAVWEFKWAYSRGFRGEQFNFVSPDIITCTDDAIAQLHTHYITETADFPVTNLDEPNGLIKARVKLLSATNTDNIFLLEADIHYSCTGKATPNKSVPFYD